MTDTGNGEWRFDGLKALFISCTLKKSPERSHTEGLVELSRGIMEKRGVETDLIRAIDHDIAIGVWPDMREHGWASDDWPELFQRVMAADILVLAGPIWLGDNSSVMKMVIERLYGCRPCSTTPGSTRTTGASVAVSSPATRTASSTAP